MQVIAGGLTCSTDLCDKITFFYLLSGRNVERVAVTVECDNSAAVAYHDAVSITALDTRRADCSVSRGINGGAFGGGKVNAVVEL